MSTNIMESTHALESFHQVCSGKARRVQGKTPPPFSLRFTVQERAYLEDQAGRQPLGAYIRTQLLGEKAKKRRTLRKPKIDDQKLAIVLSLFGDQRIAANLNQLAKHANMGTLDVSDADIAQLQEACAAMIAVRHYLLDITPAQTKAE